MKFTIKTSTLKDMVSRVIKGSSMNKLIPITSLMKIQLSGKLLELESTDAMNYVYVRQNDIEGEDFYAVVDSDLFSKLVSKMTSEFTTLEVDENTLKVNGDGLYKLALPIDEAGGAIKYPNPLDGKEFSTKYVMDLADIKSILNTVKPAVATTVEVPCYTGYYIGDSIVGTDTYKICSIRKQLFKEPVLISQDMMDLLDIMTDSSIKVDIDENHLIFFTEGCIVYGNKMQGIEDYSIDAINGLLDQNFKSMIKVSKSSLLQLLDRLNLFVDTYDKNGIYLNFSENGIMISSKKSSGVEIIPSIEVTNFSSFCCCIDIEMFTSQIKAQTGDAVEIWYGEDNAIKLVDGNVTQIIALLEYDKN